MGSRAGIGVAAVAVLLVISGCDSTRSTASQCPKPVAYDEATLKKISEALRALPPGGTMTRAQPAIKQEAHGFASVSQPCGGKRRPSWSRTSLRISVTREIAERISV